MVKNQHYVPRFYLKHFLNGEEKFWAFHKDNQKLFLTNPKGIANESYFYDQPQFDSDLGIEQPVEKYLGEVETLFAPFLNYLLKAIDNREITRLSEDMRAILCDFVMFQIIRTKEHRESMHQGINQFQEKLASTGWLSEELISAMQTCNTAERVKQTHLEQIFFDTDLKINIKLPHLACF